MSKTLLSMTDIETKRMIGVILTGMGSDGTQRLRRLKERRSISVIMQNKQTCVIDGIPRSAIESGNADKVVLLRRIPEAILNFMGVREK